MLKKVHVDKDIFLKHLSFFSQFNLLPQIFVSCQVGLQILLKYQQNNLLVDEFRYKKTFLLEVLKFN